MPANLKWPGNRCNKGRSVDQSRVLRGGSWNNNQHNARADYRNYNHPNNRNNNIGFRVVSVSHMRLRSSAVSGMSRVVTAPGMRKESVAGWRGCVLSAQSPSKGELPGAYKSETPWKGLTFGNQPLQQVEHACENHQVFQNI